MSERKVGKFSYYPSQTEVLTEELCTSFGTELLPAHPEETFPSLLTRKSQPAIVENKTNLRSTLLQFQYTKFSPFYSQRLFEVWNENRPKGVRPVRYDYKIRETIAAHPHPEGLILDERFLEQANMFRFQKALYIAAFDVTGQQIESDNLHPFNIYDNRDGYNRQAADLWIEYKRGEIFFVNRMRERREDAFDSLDFVFPRVNHEHESGLGATQNIAGSFFKEKSTEKTNTLIPWERYKLSQETPSGIVIATLQAYLRNRFTGTQLV